MSFRVVLSLGQMSLVPLTVFQVAFVYFLIILLGRDGNFIQFSFKMIQLVGGTREMAQLLRALSTLPKVLSSIPSNHMEAQQFINEIGYPLLARTCR